MSAAGMVMRENRIRQAVNRTLLGFLAWWKHPPAHIPVSTTRALVTLSRGPAP